MLIPALYFTADLVSGLAHGFRRSGYSVASEVKQATAIARRRWSHCQQVVHEHVCARRVSAGEAALSENCGVGALMTYQPINKLLW